MEQIEKIILPNIALILQQYVIIRLVRIGKGADIDFCTGNDDRILQTSVKKHFLSIRRCLHTNPLITLGSFRPLHQGIIICGFQFSLFPAFI